MSRPRIEFVVGGVQKGGTSALAQYLGAHPRLRLPRLKEAHVFDAPGFQDHWSVEDVDARYAGEFAEDEPAGTMTLHGDATPFYMFHPRVVARIARYNPGMRWILLLRDPVERALSHYHMERRRGDEHWPLWPAMLLERWRLRGQSNDLEDGSPLRHHSYRARGDYARQLDMLLAHFRREQILVMHSSRLRDDPACCVRTACDFLGVGLPPPGVGYPPVFVGDYQPPGSATRSLLRWLMRRELRDMRKRHGIDF